MDYQSLINQPGLSPRDDQKGYYETIRSYFEALGRHKQNGPSSLWIAGEAGMGKTLAYAAAAIEYVLNTDKKLLIVTDTKSNRDTIIDSINQNLSGLFLDEPRAAAWKSRYDFFQVSELRDHLATRRSDECVEPETRIEIDQAIAFLDSYPSKEIESAEFEKAGISVQAFGIEEADIGVFSEDISETQRDILTKHKIHVITHAKLIWNWGFRNYYLTSGTDADGDKTLYSAMVIDEAHNLLDVVRKRSEIDFTVNEIVSALSEIPGRETRTCIRQLKAIVRYLKGKDELASLGEFDPLRYFNQNKVKVRGIKGRVAVDDVRCILKNCVSCLRVSLRSGLRTDGTDDKYMERPRYRLSLLRLIDGISTLANSTDRHSGSSEFSVRRYAWRMEDDDLRFSSGEALPGLRDLLWIWSLDIPVVVTTAFFGPEESLRDRYSNRPLYHRHKRFFNLMAMFDPKGELIDSHSKSITLKDYGKSRWNFYRKLGYDHPLDKTTAEHDYLGEHVSLFGDVAQDIFESNKRSVVLVTSFRKGKRLEEEAKSRGVVVFRQNERSTAAIEDFRNYEGPCMLITTRWVGLDLKGQVENLIIPAIPHEPPEEIHEVVRSTSSDGGNWARHLIRSRKEIGVVIKLYQGLGRGIRDEADECTYWILDPRTPALYGDHDIKTSYLVHAYPKRFRDLAEKQFDSLLMPKEQRIQTIRTGTEV